MSTTVKLPTPPPIERYNFAPFDASTLSLTSGAQANSDTAAADREFYANSDADYNQRFPGLMDANKAVGKEVGEEATGALPAAVQSELQRGGLQSALGTFGSVTPGSIGTFGIGRNVAIGALNYTNAARDRLAAFTAANPERAFGLTGKDQESLDLGNQAEKNQVALSNNEGVNQAAYANTSMANQRGQQAYGAQTQAAIGNAANSQSSTNSAIGAAASVATIALIAF